MPDIATLGRFIPAGAGNGNTPTTAQPRWPVHPRGCGERIHEGPAFALGNGSSPRVRGTALAMPQMHSCFRFIPAGAGNGATRNSSVIAISVHPRGCGERGLESVERRGHVGSSPRVRGTVAPGLYDIEISRFIPAGAGNGACCRMVRPDSAVHPRGCGERAGLKSKGQAMTGSSPRVRGTVFCYAPNRRAHRFIPAGAGNGTTVFSRVLFWPVHPRGCGERWQHKQIQQPESGSSPRVRGTAELGRHKDLFDRFIPAGAGNG